jgi:hypothetical protein
MNSDAPTTPLPRSRFLALPVLAIIAAAIVSQIAGPAAVLAVGAVVLAVLALMLINAEDGFTPTVRVVSVICSVVLLVVVLALLAYAPIRSALAVSPSENRSAEETGRTRDLSSRVLKQQDIPTRDARSLVLVAATLDHLQLRGRRFDGVAAAGALFRGADLRGANLRGADLRGADLTGACLRGAHLEDASLQGAVFTGTDLTRATYDPSAPAATIGWPTGPTPAVASREACGGGG